MSEPATKWQVITLRQTERVLRRLPRDLLERIRAAVQGLAQDPWPPGCKRLVGHRNMYRIRVGNWRIIYVIETDRSVVVIVEIAPRGEAYRDL